MRVKTRTSTTGKSNNRGYTLVELVLVMVLCGIAFTLAIPALRDSILDDSLDAVTRRLVGTARQLKNDAIREGVDCILHLDLSGGSYWITSADMTPEKKDEMQEKAFRLPSGVRFADIAYSAAERQTDGEATITFFKRGYVQPAVIRLAKGERFSVLLFQPFLRVIQVSGGYGLEGGEKGWSYAEFR